MTAHQFAQKLLEGPDMEIYCLEAKEVRKHEESPILKDPSVWESSRIYADTEEKECLIIS